MPESDDEEPPEWKIDEYAREAVQKIEDGEYNVDDAMGYMESQGFDPSAARKELYKRSLREGTQHYVNADTQDVMQSSTLTRLEQMVEKGKEEKARNYLDMEEDSLTRARDEYQKAGRDLQAAQELRRSYLGTVEAEEVEEELVGGWDKPVFTPDPFKTDMPIRGLAMMNIIRAVWNRDPSYVIGHSAFVDDTREKQETAEEKHQLYTQKLATVREELEDSSDTDEDNEYQS